MNRTLPMHRALLAAHNFAERHVTTNGTPNPAAFDEEWDAFTARNPKLTFADLQIIYAYAAAALHYKPRKRFYVRDTGGVLQVIPVEHEAVDLPRGMWAGRSGNVDVTAGQTA